MTPSTFIYPICLQLWWRFFSLLLTISLFIGKVKLVVAKRHKLMELAFSLSRAQIHHIIEVNCKFLIPLMMQSP